jgi:hypothetical protein
MKKLSGMRACTAATLCAATAFAGENRTPRAIWVVSELMKSELEAVLNTERLNKKRQTGSRTRGSPPAYKAASTIWTIAVFVSRPAVAGHRRRLTIAPLLGRLFGQAKRL